MKKLAIYIGIIVVSLMGGMHYEATKIQKTCDDPDSPTVLNGQAYVCLDAHQMEIIRSLIQRRTEA